MPLRENVRVHSLHSVTLMNDQFSDQYSMQNSQWTGFLPLRNVSNRRQNKRNRKKNIQLFHIRLACLNYRCDNFFLCYLSEAVFSSSVGSSIHLRWQSISKSKPPGLQEISKSLIVNNYATPLGLHVVFAILSHK